MIPTDGILEAFHLEESPMNLGRGFGTNQFLGTSRFLLFLYHVPSGLVFFALWSCVVLPTRPTIFMIQLKFISLRLFQATSYCGHLPREVTPTCFPLVLFLQLDGFSSNLMDLVRFRHPEGSLD
jgi:hypothetical protein